MDTDALVKEGKRLVTLLDEAGFPPRGAMLVNNTETDTWRLWIVPHQDLLDKAQFYRQVSSLIIDHQDEFSLLDAGDVDLRSADHPATQGLARFIRLDGLGDVHMGGNAFNGFYLPNGILLRMAL